MYRSEADLIMGFNCLALAMIETGARLLGETSPFCLEVVGSYHLQTALNYVLRQGLHHGLSTSPFGYPHCSANAFFRKELGKDYTPALLAPSAQYKYLPDGKKLPPGIQDERQRLDYPGGCDRYGICREGISVGAQLRRRTILETIHQSSPSPSMPCAIISFFSAKRKTKPIIQARARKKHHA